MNKTASLTTETNAKYVGNDRLLFGIVLGVLAFWLFAQTTQSLPTSRTRQGKAPLRAVRCQT